MVPKQQNTNYSGVLYNHSVKRTVVGRTVVYTPSEDEVGVVPVAREDARHQLAPGGQMKRWFPDQKPVCSNIRKHPAHQSLDVYFLKKRKKGKINTQSTCPHFFSPSN